MQETIGTAKVLAHCKMGANGETRYLVLVDRGPDAKPEPQTKAQGPYTKVCEIGRFVTGWTSTSMLDRGEWLMGHYFDTVEGARDDFAERITKAEIEA